MSDVGPEYQGLADCPGSESDGDVGLSPWILHQGGGLLSWKGHLPQVHGW